MKAKQGLKAKQVLIEAGNKILEGAKLYGTIIGLVAMIGIISVKYDRHETIHKATAASIDSIIATTNKTNQLVQVTNAEVRSLKDSIALIQKLRVQEKQDMEHVRNSLKATQKTFLSYISKNNSLTKTDFLQYMNSIEFYLKVDDPEPRQKGWDSLSIRFEPLKK